MLGNTLFYFAVLKILFHELAGVINLDGRIHVLKGFQPTQIKVEVGCPVTLYCTFNHPGAADNWMYGKFYKQEHGMRKYIDGDKESINCSSRVSQERPFVCKYSLTINYFGPADENTYYCEVLISLIEEAVTVEGNGTKVSVYAEPSSIVIQPVSSLVSGQEATLLCVISGFYHQDLSVIWFHGQLPVQPSHYTTVLQGTQSDFSVHSRYRFRPTEADHTAVCVCRASHPAWTRHRTASIMLNISYAPISVTVTSALVAVSHGTVCLAVGSPLYLNCTADGNPNPETQWLREDVKVEHGRETLIIHAVQKEHEGIYWCVAQNQYGGANTSITIQLTNCNGYCMSTCLAVKLLAVGMLLVVNATMVCYLKMKKTKS